MQVTHNKISEIFFWKSQTKLVQWVTSYCCGCPHDFLVILGNLMTANMDPCQMEMIFCFKFILADQPRQFF